MLLRLILTTALLSTLMPAQEKPNYPPSRREDLKETIHGVTVEDPYRWLEDQKSPETRQWIDSENAYTEKQIGQLPTRPYLEKHLAQLLKVDATKSPIERAGHYFYLSRKADHDQFILYMRANANAALKVLVDPHPLSPDHSTSVTIEDVTTDASLLAYGLRKGGADEEEIHFRDIATNKDLADVLPAARYFNIALLPDRTGFYYDIMTDAGPRVRFHKFGSDVAQDTEIFGHDLGQQIITVSFLNDDGHYFFTEVMYGSSADKVEIYFADLKEQAPDKVQLKPLIKNGPGQDMDCRFFLVPAGDHAFVHTNWRAPNGRILDIDLKHPLRPHWNQAVAERPDAVIDNLSVVGGKLAVAYFKNVGSEIRFFTPEGMPAGEVTFPAIGTADEFHGRWSSPVFSFQYSSFHIPPTIYTYNTKTKTKSVFAQTKAPVNSAELELKQVWYNSKDGTKIPMFLLHKKGLKLDGNAPTYLTAYGGFNVAKTPLFTPIAVTWAQNGGVFAMPNLRGGGEFGEAWHKAGMFEHKQNVFDDMIAAAEWLVANKYTSPAKLAATGRSNGGLLMGAMMTQRPDLFRAIVCGYPLLDMVRYQNFLVARFWVSEYGSSEDAKQFPYILKYSPYHNVKQGTNYPSILFITGDADTRVAPLHARKMTALMQWAQGNPEHPVLLHYDTKAGHSEGRAVAKIIEDDTDELSFLWWQLGVTTTDAAETAAMPKAPNKVRTPKVRKK
jgi:prolyl oligopeptidase